MDELAKASLETLAEIEDVGPVTAESIRQFFKSDSGKQVIAELKAPRSLRQQYASPLLPNYQFFQHIIALKD